MSVATGTPSKDTANLRNFVKRNGTAVGAAAAGIVAVVLLVAALSGGDDSAPVASETPVVVATQVIHRGSRLDSRAVADTLRVRRISADEAQAAAVTSLSDVHGKVATSEILAGEQITTESLSSDRSGLASRITGAYRAVTLPIDSAHGMVGDLSAGDRVDVYASFDTTDEPRRPAVLKMIATNIEVLRAPSATDGSEDNDPKAAAQVTLALKSTTAANAAFAADNGEVWIVARPAAGATSSGPKSITLGSLLRAAATTGEGS